MGRKQRRGAAPQAVDPHADPSAELRARILGSQERATRGGREWQTRQIPATRATKVYRCPGCPNDIPVGQAHLVVWRADHLFGDDAGVSERRHWHSHCWRLA